MAISVGYHCAATDLARCSGRSGGGELCLECFQLGPCPLPQALHLAHLHHTGGPQARSGISDPMIRRLSPFGLSAQGEESRAAASSVALEHVRTCSRSLSSRVGRWCWSRPVPASRCCKHETSSHCSDGSLACVSSPPR